MKNLKIVWVSMFVIVMAGCSSLGNKVDQESLGRMKKVALIGLTIDEREAASAGAFGRGLLGMEDGDGFGGGKVGFELEKAPHVDAAYDIASKTLADRLKVSFLARAKVAANPEVKNLYEKKNATVQTGVPPLKPYYHRFEATGIPQFYFVQWADKEILNQTAKSLGVDGLVIISSKTDISAGIVSSISSTATVNIMFYDPKLSEFSTYVNQQGDSVGTKESKVMGFAEANEMHMQSLEAMRVALTQIVSKF